MPDLPAAAIALRLMAFALGVYPSTVGVAELQGDYAAVRADYRERIAGAVLRYLVQDGARATAFKTDAGQAVLEAFPVAFGTGYLAGSGSGEIDPADDRWLTARINAEIDHVAALFLGLREIKAEQLPPADLVAESERRADGYARTLDAVHQEGFARGQKNRMATWRLGPTEQHCGTCAALNGQRHRVSWYLARNYIPGKPGSSTDCGGWKCGCRWETDDGEVFAVPG
ncbi:MAG: hypothetical protein IT318_23700 [Anaerolineales bacterium]|nr:hypothetical protein [Anaerolineales bacterium]